MTRSINVQKVLCMKIKQSMHLMQAVLNLPGEGRLDCLTCSFVRQKESMVAAYSDGRTVLWDLTDLAEVIQFFLCSF